MLCNDLRNIRCGEKRKNWYIFISCTMLCPLEQAWCVLCHVKLCMWGIYQEWLLIKVSGVLALSITLPGSSSHSHSSSHFSPHAICLGAPVKWQEQESRKGDDGCIFKRSCKGVKLRVSQGPWLALQVIYTDSEREICCKDWKVDR